MNYLKELGITEKEYVANELKKWCNGCEFNTAATLTFARAANFETTEYKYGKFLHNLNSSVLGRRHKVHKEQMNSFAVYELKDSSYHIHLLLNRPKHKSFTEIKTTINRIWQTITKPEKGIMQTDVQDMYSEKYFDYCVKFIDAKNTSSRISSYAFLHTVDEQCSYSVTL